MPSGDGFTVEDFVARSAASKVSIEKYAYCLRQLEGWLAKPLALATERDLGVLKHKLRGMAAGKHYANLLRMFYKAAGREDLRAICMLKQRLKRLAPDDLLTVADVQRVIDAAPTLRDRALLAVLWETGARIHEALALTLGDVRSKADNGRSIFVLWFRKTKIAGEEHTGYVMESSPLLAAWVKAHPRPRPDAPLFPNASGQPLDRHGGFRIVQRAARRAGIGKRVYPHLFRHSRATHLLRLGISEGQVKQLLGWTPASGMLSRYAHLVDRDVYVGLMKAQGYETVESVDLGKLAFDEDALKPVVPMNAPVARALPGGELEDLLRDPKVLRFLKLALETASENSR